MSFKDRLERLERQAEARRRPPRTDAERARLVRELYEAADRPGASQDVLYRAGRVRDLFRRVRERLASERQSGEGLEHLREHPRPAGPAGG